MTAVKMNKKKQLEAPLKLKVYIGTFQSLPEC